MPKNYQKTSWSQRDGETKKYEYKHVDLGENIRTSLYCLYMHVDQ